MKTITLDEAIRQRDSLNEFIESHKRYKLLGMDTDFFEYFTIADNLTLKEVESMCEKLGHGLIQEIL